MADSSGAAHIIIPILTVISTTLLFISTTLETRLATVTKLRLFGCLHMNTRSVVESDLQTFAGDADAFAIENPVEDSLVDVFRVNAAVPIVSVGMTLMGLLVQIPLFLLLQRDIVQAELLALQSVVEERPTHNVDQHPISIVADRGWPWIVGNWLLFGALLVVVPVSMVVLTVVVLLTTLTQTVRRRYGYRYATSAVAAATIAGLVWTMVAGYLNPFVVLGLIIVAMVVVRLSLGGRNEVMLEEVAALADEHDYDEVCLLTGKLHVPGMLEIAPDYGFTVTEAFGQRWRTAGCWFDREGEPIRNATAERAGKSLARRAPARAIDVVVVGIAIVALVVVQSVVVTFAGISWDQQVVAGVTYDHLGLLSWLLVPVAYDTVTEGLWDRTLGKRLLGLRVAKRDGSDIGFVDAFLRSLFGLIDSLPVLYLFGGLLSLFDTDGRRFGDRVAGAVVVPASAAAESPSADARPKHATAATAEKSGDHETAPWSTDEAEDESPSVGDSTPANGTDDATGATKSATAPATGETGDRTESGSVDAEWTAATGDDER